MPQQPKRLVEPPQRIRLGGVVYTAVLNPADGRKNRHDMLTAFCRAFPDNPDATLVMKMVRHDRFAFEGALAILIRLLQPFRCRVVAPQGWLDDAEYDALVAATDYYVNTSSCEGPCLPVMEFMSAGRPAIAPDHAAMADYIDDSNVFVLRSGVEHDVWPHDPRDLFRTMRHRLEWDSLMDAYRASYDVATNHPLRYAAMAEAAAPSPAASIVCGSRARRRARTSRSPPSRLRSGTASPPLATGSACSAARTGSACEDR